MLTTYDDVLGYLLKHQWISNEVVVDGGLRLVDASRRNSNFEVSRFTRPQYFIKQEIRDHVGGERKPASVAYEAAVYELLAIVHGRRPVFRSIPRFHAFDPDEQILILEASAGYVSLATHSLGRGRFSSAIASALGATLADLHTVSEEETITVAERIGLPNGPPWIFDLPRPDGWMRTNASRASLELIEIVQRSSELCEAFDDLKGCWRNTGFIHGDLKWDNCLVSVTPRQRPRLRIVDWELARLGDRRWDVGTVFSEYLTYWLSSVPIVPEHPPDRFLEHARFPLAALQPAVRAFWTAYVKRACIPASELTSWIERTTGFAAIRLVQTAFEQLQIEGALTTRAVFHLQLSANIVARPLEAAVQLLGLHLPPPAYDFAALGPTA